MSTIVTFDKGRLRLSGDLTKVREAGLGMNLAPDLSLEAQQYRDLITKLRSASIPYKDEASAYKRITLPLKERLAPRTHQIKAMQAWKQAGYKGVVSLPTGSGKTILAVYAISEVGRSTLVVVPTLDLVKQWVAVLQRFFECSIGQLGGGVHTDGDIVVATYDSAFIYMKDYGARFGFVIFDECHHLPSESYASIARNSLAPFRLGLSATLERSDGGEERLDSLVGPLVFEESVHNLSQADVLAPYQTKIIKVALTEEEATAYQNYREIYLRFIQMHKIKAFGGAGGWQEFLRKCGFLPGGRAALFAYQKQKQIYQQASAKIDVVWDLMMQHRNDRMIIFTNNNRQAYEIGTNFVLPVISHHTKARERSSFLAAFANGELNVLVTSKVLNEGVDVPSANIAIVVSGSSTVREHVQRLGRILRHQPGKQAILYELITDDTAELSVLKKRRQHDAYKRT